MNSQDTKKPTDGVTMRRIMESPDPNDHLLERVLSRENMQRAWTRVEIPKATRVPSPARTFISAR